MAEKKKWALYGCLGCLGIVVLLVLCGAIIVGVAYVQVGKEQVEQHLSTQELPTFVAAEAENTEQLAPVPQAGRVVLDLTRTEFHIRPLQPGEEMRVEATYDKNSFELIESLEQTEGEGWTYRVRFAASGSNMMALLKQLFGGIKPEVSVFLPTDVPIHLELELSEGGGDLDLSGMWLTELDVQFNKGGLELSVDEPLLYPAERISLQGAMSGMDISRLGNASPRRLDVGLEMGGLNLDLRGQWLNDSDISITTHMGGTAVQLPRDVTIIGLDSGGLQIPKETEIPLPTLRFTTSVTSGEIEVIP